MRTFFHYRLMVFPLAPYSPIDLVENECVALPRVFPQSYAVIVDVYRGNDICTVFRQIVFCNAVCRLIEQ